MFVHLKKLLSKTINKHGLKGEIDALMIINEFKKQCEEQLGKDSLENLIPRFYKKKKLYINASNSAWAHHLHIRQTPIIEKIKDAVGENEFAGFNINIKNNA